MYVGCRSAVAILQIEQLDACICAFLCMWIVEGACTCMYTRDAGFDVVEREELKTV